MEEEQTREQPEYTQQNAQNNNVEESKENGGQVAELNGSLGKFKDAESLLVAYNNLQAEFTRKCQKLSEVTKQLETAEPELNQNSQSQTPVFEKENWQETVVEFLDNNAEAKEYSSDICDLILNDKQLQNSPNALELAWAKIMKKEFALPKNLAHDQNFINEQILSQEQVKKQVLDEYFKNLQNINNPPLISKQGIAAFASQKAPQTLGEAKQMVEKLFNLKG